MKKRILLLLLTICLSVVFGKASFYGNDGSSGIRSDGYAWKRTASGEIMNPNKLTCASWHYPLGTKLKVTRYWYKNNKKMLGKTVIVKVNDRGGYHHLDLSGTAFQRLAPLSRGIIRVKVETLR